MSIKGALTLSSETLWRLNTRSGAQLLPLQPHTSQGPGRPLHPPGPSPISNLLTSHIEISFGDVWTTERDQVSVRRIPFRACGPLRDKGVGAVTSCRSSSAEMLLWNGWKVGTGPFSGSWKMVETYLRVGAGGGQPWDRGRGFLFPHPFSPSAGLSFFPFNSFVLFFFKKKKIFY